MKATTLQTAVLIAAFSLHVSLLQAASPQDAPPVDPAIILRELEAAVKKRETAESSVRQKIANTLRNALAGGAAASSLYEQAIKATDFDGKAGGASDFANWRKKNADLLRSEQMQSAITYHVRYLLISLQLRDNSDQKEAAESSFAYAKDYARLFTDKKYLDLPKPAAELLSKPLKDGPFVKWLALGDRLPADKEWAPTAGNLGDILDKNVRPVWRAHADPRLDSTWALQSDYEAARAAAGKLEWAQGQFDTLVKPRLVFGRASDRAGAGQPNLAVKDMLDLIKTHPNHPDWPAWVEKLKSLISSPPPTG